MFDQMPNILHRRLATGATILNFPVRLFHPKILIFGMYALLWRSGDPGQVRSTEILGDYRIQFWQEHWIRAMHLWEDIHYYLLTWQQTVPPRTHGGWCPVSMSGVSDKEPPMGSASALAPVSHYDRDTCATSREDTARRLISQICLSGRPSLSAAPPPRSRPSVQKALAALKSESTSSYKAIPRRRCGTGG